MLSFAFRHFFGTLPAVLLLAVVAAYATPAGPEGLARAAAGLPRTAALVAGALAVGLAAGIPFGLLAHYRPRSPAGRLGRMLGGIGAAVPGFLAAALAVTALGPGSSVEAAAALAVPILAEAARLARRGADAAAEQGFVLAARGRGVSARHAFLHHALPAALVPVVGVLGGLAAATTAGAVAAEALFGLPGTGRMLVEAARAGDAGGTAAAAALLAGLVLLLRAVGGILCGHLDPRARVG
ncbi:MAG TPA: ABC transporter permease subunit [Azospirillum sp.]|nr:ABC transporter permease subunit [Azospirillum sp.]